MVRSIECWAVGALTALCGSVASAATETDYYEIHSAQLAKDLVLEVSGIARLADGRLMICTRRGELYLVRNAYSKPWEPRFKLWAFGLAEPLGIIEHNGWIYAAQRAELTRMKDIDGDDRADVFETVSDAWGISGAYHEYNFGPRLDKQGFLWVTLNVPFGSETYGPAPWRGWAVRIHPKTGALQPIAAGLRSPAGIEVAPWGDVFYTDNQGEWANASKLSQLEPGDFHGHPVGLRDIARADAPFKSPKIEEVKNGALMKDLKHEIPNFKMPAVWFPYGRMGNSPSGIEWDTSRGKFGPFSGQALVGDQTHSKLIRVFLEKIDGHWQGACFDFRQGFDSGIIRVEFGTDQSLFVGMSNRGWSSHGNKEFGLQRVTWTGKTPFEILEMRAKPDGFLLTFTEPVDPGSAVDVAGYSGKSYTYRLRGEYGGPDEDIRDLNIKSAQVGADKKSVKLVIEPVRAGYVHELHAVKIKSARGEALLHPEAYYTLVNVPKR
jgi:hypothetical protein